MFGRIDWWPDRQKIKSFALSLAIAAILMALLLLWASGQRAALSVAAAGVSLALLSWLLPTVGRLVYWVWMGVSFALGRITSPLFTALIFYLVITPVGWLRRLGLRDPLALRSRPEQQSYFEEHPRINLPDDFKRQF
ncbi:MAG: hypothetical protein ABIJ61_02820 [bacterium]